MSEALPLGEVLQGDCLELLKGLPDACVDSVVTDPPYGLSDHKPADVAACMMAWAQGEEYRPNKCGFMNRLWDAWVPGPEVWREVFRVLKPGGTALVFAGTRTQDLMGIALRLAGFEITDCLQWMYGNGFPKSLDIGKAIDKAAQVVCPVCNGASGRHNPETGEWGPPCEHCGNKGWVKGAERQVMGPSRYHCDGRKDAIPDTTFTNASPKLMGNKGPITAQATDLAREWDGWGTALKPSHEPIILARKPCEGSFAANAEAWGVAGLNIDGCRVGTNPGYKYNADKNGTTFHGQQGERIRQSSDKKGAPIVESTAGRWPANLILQHAPGCVCVGEERVAGEKPGRMIAAGSLGRNGIYGKSADHFTQASHADPDGLETVAKWECVDGCPVKALAEQSGGASYNPEGIFAVNQPGGWPGGNREVFGYGDTGTAARFFEQFPHEPEPDFNYIAKAARAEREAGLRGHLPCAICGDLNSTKHVTDSGREANCFRNQHPTVKPVALMRWLCRLTKTPTGGIVLDPFAGSGTTLVAALLEGRDFIGMELDAAYCEIARKRIAEARAKHQPAFDLEAAG